MKPIVLDKIASVTASCRLQREARLSSEFPCREGDVIAVRVMTSKSTYDQLELTTGRFCKLNPGDVVAGALGHRNALKGFAGRLPEKLAVGDVVNILNLGGVIGIYEDGNPKIGRPFECEVLGQVLSFPYLGERIGVPASIQQAALPLEEPDLEGLPPLVALVGSSMDAGKTSAATALIQELVRRRVRVSAAKATGVSLRRDVLAMEDAGAFESLVFTDFGVVTTQPKNAPGLARAMLARLARRRPDVVVMELGDGLLGTYGVDAILADPVFQKALKCMILCASDPVAAWGGVKRLEEAYGLRPDLLSGPATDNVAGNRILEQMTGLPAVNALVHPDRFADVVVHTLGAAGVLECDAEERS